ncbi:hypothetical protein B0I21_102169 [Sphingobacterium paludis]|uniref:Uncharacterized protein n=1 Tax=Sphingobacterium paludis TaxID=1476465 RepID=A0A4R7D655_9SPHI|nr:hypothetical protein B0I21_102169 [Sphingobacterium paludis]
MDDLAKDKKIYEGNLFAVDNGLEEIIILAILVMPVVFFWQIFSRLLKRK